MNNDHQGNRLFLYCTDLEYFPGNLSGFIRQCQENGLLSGRDNNLHENDYRVGEKFLQHISFLGCSPYLKTEPEHEHDQNYCYVHISVPGVIRFISGKHPKPPSCPGCKKRLNTENDFISAWHKDKNATAIQCAHCHNHFSIYDLHWHKNAGFVNFTIEISGIFPKEAIPGPLLLSWLKSVTGSEWQYFYA